MLPNATRTPVPVRTLQPQLTTWLTEESPDASEAAAKAGATVLTALMHHAGSSPAWSARRLRHVRVRSRLQPGRGQQTPQLSPGRPRASPQAGLTHRVRPPRRLVAGAPRYPSSRRLREVVVEMMNCHDYMERYAWFTLSIVTNPMGLYNGHDRQCQRPTLSDMN